MSIDKLRQRYILNITLLDQYLTKANSILNDQSLNVHIEYTAIKILNIAFNLELKNANRGIGNFKAIDAFDTKNNLSYQITSNVRFDKIFNTLVKYSEDQLFEKYGQLNFFYLKKKGKLSLLNKEKISQICEDKFSFTQENLFDFYDILEVISDDYEKLEKTITILEQELNLLPFHATKGKVNLGISISFEPNPKDLKNIVYFIDQLYITGYSIFISEKVIYDLVNEKSDINHVTDLNQIPYLSACIHFMNNVPNRIENCVILEKSFEAQTVHQNIAFEKITNFKSQLIDRSCYKYLTKDTIRSKCNKIILSLDNRIKRKNYFNKEGIDELISVFNAFQHKKMNKSEGSDNYFTYHKFSAYGTTFKFLVIRKNVVSFKEVRDYFRVDFPEDKNFIVLSHKDSSHTSKRRLQWISALFEPKESKYLTDIIGETFKNNFIKTKLLNEETFIEPVITDINHNSSDIGEIFNWFNEEDSPVIFIIGQGGIGKTTLCKYIHDKLIEKDQIVLYIDAGRFHAELDNNTFVKGNDSYDLYNFYKKWIDKTPTQNELLSRNSFYSNLNNGNIKIIFDGLDEILSTKPNFKLSYFLNFIQDLTEVSNLSKIVIAIRDYQYKLLRREFRSDSDAFNSYEAMNVELFSEDMSDKYFSEHFKNSPKLVLKCKELLGQIILEEKSIYRHPPYVLFLITQIISDDIVPIEEDLQLDDLIEKINDLDRILIEFLNREYGKKDYIQLGIGVKDQLSFLIELAYQTLGEFNEATANKVIKSITNNFHTEAFFEKLKDHPYLTFDDGGKSEIFDFKFDFLRDHLRSIKLHKLISDEKAKINNYDIEILATFLTPQSILYKLLADRLNKNKQGKLYKFIKRIINSKSEYLNEGDFDYAISNLFILALELKGKNKRATVYTEVMKKIFSYENENEIRHLRLIDCHHGLGITFQFNDLIFYNSKIQQYSRFFESDFNQNTYFWSNCHFTDLSYEHINISSIKCSTINFDEKISGDGSHLEIILKKDSNYSISHSQALNSIKSFVSCLIYAENKSKFSKFSLQANYLIDKKFSADDFDLVFAEFVKSKIISPIKDNYCLRRSQLGSLSKFFDNSYMSTEIYEVFKILKNYYN